MHFSTGGISRGLRALVTLAIFQTALLGQPAHRAQNETEKWFEGLDWSGFEKLEAAQQEIDPDNFDTNLLSAAVFHQTNRRREEEGLPMLSAHRGARRAAALQAEIMAARGSISHENPDKPRLRTLQDRLKAVELRPRFAAENVATAFVLKYESGIPVYPRKENGRTVFSLKPGGEPIPKHTYASFAKALLDQWMKSPGHRENILARGPEHLGASCRRGPDQSGMPVLYCAQLFFTPLNE